MPVLPRDARRIVGRSTNVGDTGVMQSIDRSGARGPVRKATGSQRLTHWDTQPLTPVEGAASGDPVAVPSGAWLVVVEVSGNYDDIAAGFTYALGEDTLSYGGWVAHRPSGEETAAAGPLDSVPVNGGTVTPLITVTGAGEGSVRVVVRFIPSEDA